MGLLEFATENEKKGQKIHGFSARLVRGWLKLRADHLERQLNLAVRYLDELKKYEDCIL